MYIAAVIATFLIFIYAFGELAHSVLEAHRRLKIDLRPEVPRARKLLVCAVLCAVGIGPCVYYGMELVRITLDHLRN